MREASRDKATPLEEGGRKDNLDRCHPPFGKVRGVANRSDCLDGSDWALAHSLNDDHSQTAWLGDAICTRHRNTQWSLTAILLWYESSSDWLWTVRFLLQCAHQGFNFCFFVSVKQILRL